MFPPYGFRDPRFGEAPPAPITASAQILARIQGVLARGAPLSVLPVFVRRYNEALRAEQQVPFPRSRWIVWLGSSRFSQTSPGHLLRPSFTMEMPSDQSDVRVWSEDVWDVPKVLARCASGSGRVIVTGLSVEDSFPFVLYSSTTFAPRIV